jgi:hypothetical protein
MEIYTCFAPEYTEVFRKLKRKTSGEWKLLVRGEWSQSTYHEGNHRFYVRHSNDKHYWAILSTGIPSRIVAVAHTPEPVELEVIAATMLRVVREHDGDCIDLAHEFGKFDRDTFWAIYRAKKNAA